MSIVRTQSEPTDYDPCSYCGGTVTRQTVSEGSYCSRECYRREKGQNALDALRHDHQIYSTCYGQIKEVAPITKGPETVREGIQYQTERTTIGIDVFADPDEQRNDAIEGTRWSCECGAVDPTTTEASIQNMMLAEVIDNCFLALEYLHDRGKVPNPPSKRRYYDALREHWRDARYAIGAAIYG